MGPENLKGGGKPVENMSTDEKAAQVFSMIQNKHLLWIVPLVSGGVLTTLVVSHKWIKDSVEAIAPSYINLVRKHYGFDEEDIERDAWEQEMLLSNSQPVDVEVTLTRAAVGSGSKEEHKLELRGVSGTTTIPELMQLIEKAGAPQVSEALGDPLIVSFSFKDSSDTLVVAHHRSALEALRSAVANKHKEPPLGEEPWAYARAPVGAELRGGPFAASEWSHVQAAGKEGKGGKILVDKKAKAKGGAQDQTPQTQTELLLTYCNTANRLLDSFQSYLSFVGSSSGYGAIKARRAAQSYRPSAQQLKKLRASELEKRLDELRRELKSSGSTGGMKITREIDAIQADIMHVQRELSSLKGWWF